MLKLTKIYLPKSGLIFSRALMFIIFVWYFCDVIDSVFFSFGEVKRNAYGGEVNFYLYVGRDALFALISFYFLCFGLRGNNK